MTTNTNDGAKFTAERKQSRRQAYATFKQEFSDLCSDWRGVYSERDTIDAERGDAAFLFETPLGVLCASIHAPYDYKREEILPGSIYMRFHTYSGPVDGPGSGDFNRYSHKWNIHFSGDACGARQAALLELYARLSKLMAEDFGLVTKE